MQRRLLLALGLCLLIGRAQAQLIGGEEDEEEEEEEEEEESVEDETPEEKLQRKNIKQDSNLTVVRRLMTPGQLAHQLQREFTHFINRIN